jgi:hypothetical protein
LESRKGNLLLCKEERDDTHIPLKYRQSQKWREKFVVCEVVENIHGEEIYKELTVIRTELDKQGQFLFYDRM